MTMAGTAALLDPPPRGCVGAWSMPAMRFRMDVRKTMKAAEARKATRRMRRWRQKKNKGTTGGLLLLRGGCVFVRLQGRVSGGGDEYHVMS